MERKNQVIAELGTRDVCRMLQIEYLRLDHGMRGMGLTPLTGDLPMAGRPWPWLERRIRGDALAKGEALRPWLDSLAVGPRLDSRAPPYPCPRLDSCGEAERPPRRLGSTAGSCAEAALSRTAPRQIARARHASASCTRPLCNARCSQEVCISPFFCSADAARKPCAG